jgi:hypothetical protein
VTQPAAPVLHPGRSDPSVSRSAWQRRRLLVFGLALALILLIGGGAWWALSRPGEASRETVRPPVGHFSQTRTGIVYALHNPNRFHDIKRMVYTLLIFGRHNTILTAYTPNDTEVAPGCCTISIPAGQTARIHLPPQKSKVVNIELNTIKVEVEQTGG